MRSASVKIRIRSKDVTMDLAPHLLSLTYTDNSDNGLDDLQLTLEDRDRIWQSYWLPDPGESIQARIVVEDWRHPGDASSLDCGTFEIDELELSSDASGGDTVTIKAVPGVVKSSLMSQRKTRAWGDVPLSSVLADIASSAGLDALYRAAKIVFQRIEQRQESDLAFLTRVAKDQGLRLAVKTGRLVLYSGQRADVLTPLVYRRGESAVSGLRLRRSMAGVYTRCVVGYTSAADSSTTGGEYEPEESPDTGKVLTINKRVESPAQAERLAKAELRDKNCRELTGSLDAMGDTRLRAGTVVRLDGWGGFDGDYVARQVTHTVDRDSGYRTSADLVKALDY